MFFKCTLVAVFASVLTIAYPVSSFAQGLDRLAGVSAEHDTASKVSEEPSAPAKLEPVSAKVTDNENPQKEVSAPSYVLGADDVINVTVYGENDLSKSYKIGSTGLISFPLIGEINVSGKTTRQVEQVLREKLLDGYLVNPDVSVEVASYRPFYILGEVRNPGSYDYTNGATVLKAVALAGGFTYRANKKEVQVLKTKNAGSDLYDKVSVDTSIGPGDIILVKERFF